MLWDYMKEVVGNHSFVNLIDFDEIIATAMETILKNKLRQESVGKGGEMTSRGRRNDKLVEEEEMNVIAGNVNGE
jgi:hypothetical protein